MRRLMLVASTMALLVSSVALADDPPPKSPASVQRPTADVSPRKAPVKGIGRRAMPGDDAAIHDTDSPGCISIRHLEGYMKAKAAGDEIGMSEYPKLKLGFPLSTGTKLLVIQAHLAKVDMTPISIDTYARQAQASASSVGSPKPVESIEVRVLDGEHKGKALFVPVESIALMRPDPIDERIKKDEEELDRRAEKRAVRDAAKVKQSTPEARAASLLAIAKNLEKSGKTKPALENYRKIVKDFPDLPSAKEAAGRIKVLEPK